MQKGSRRKNKDQENGPDVDEDFIDILNDFEVASNSFSQGLDYLEEFGKATLEVLRDVQEKDYLFQDPF